MRETSLPECTERLREWPEGTRQAGSTLEGCQLQPSLGGKDVRGGGCIPKQEGGGVHDDVTGEGEGLGGDEDTHREVQGPGSHNRAGPGSLRRKACPPPWPWPAQPGYL